MKKRNLTEGNIKQQLISMTLPMIFGMLGMVIFNLVDTYFVGKLGVKQLAAISFTFPVIMIINSVALGIGIGTSSLIARNIINQEKSVVQKIATRSIMLGVLIVFSVIIIGLFTIKPLFVAIGAEGEILSLVSSYMYIWYPGVIFVVIPMVGNNIVRATGDTFLPGILMVVSATVNAILDPFLIFGIGPFPALGIKGAAIATVLARSTGLIFILIVLIRKYGLLTLKMGKVKDILATWKQVLYIAGPATITMLITPISIGIITKILANFGEFAVAGFGVATKVESFALMVINALGSVLVIFAGQNFSKKQFDRIFKAIKYATIFSLLWGIFIFVASQVFAENISMIFSKDSAVVEVTSKYMKIVSLSYIFLNLLSIAVSVFNGVNKPVPSAFFSSLRMIGLYVPLAWLFSNLFGLYGIFGAAFIANVSIGVVTMFFLIRILKKMSSNHFVAEHI